jgi:hypothetical protein
VSPDLHSPTLQVIPSALVRRLALRKLRLTDEDDEDDDEDNLQVYAANNKGANPGRYQPALTLPTRYSAVGLLSVLLLSPTAVGESTLVGLLSGL